MRFECFIYEKRVPAFACPSLKRQRDEVPEAAGRHGILIRKEAIVGLEADFGPAFHRFGQQGGTELPRVARSHVFGEEDPHVPALPGSRALECCRNVPRTARFEER